MLLGKENEMKKRIISLLIATTMLLSVFTGCGDSKESSNGDAYTVRVATMTTGFTVALHYAIEQGVYDELGINVEESFFDNGPSINEAIAAGDIDVGGIGEMPAITGALANGSKVIAWMEDDAASVQIYARNDSDIVSAGEGHIADCPAIYGTKSEWKGKEIICATGTSSHFALLATLNALGLKESDISIINMEGSAGAAAFASGTGDLFVGFDPQWANMYTNKDEYTMVSSIEAANQELSCFLIGSDDFVSNHEKEAELIVKGLLMAQNELREDEELYKEAMYNWQATFGGQDEELAAYSASLKPFRTVEEQAEMMDDEEGVSPILDSMIMVANFMADNNLIEKSDIDALKDMNPVNKDIFTAAASTLE